jgi:hypothetical protein
LGLLFQSLTFPLTLHRLGLFSFPNRDLQAGSKKIKVSLPVSFLASLIFIVLFLYFSSAFKRYFVKIICCFNPVFDWPFSVQCPIVAGAIAAVIGHRIAEKTHCPSVKKAAFWEFTLVFVFKL